ncbi:Fe-S cluster assembly sulfur transfer protein SufU [Acidocella sp. KAb 2-4]|uniref:Fe-S cluster assembly sulfur transfer protein SufU n=1 Tax=Acidocella sp. KAb 2-4 TaxID=2885158 RepID=UPI001D078D1B|nr:SUF system NifU family Fe-S cluster assembly protein [Acidocella sp. KAb 2-4]MCB5945366.1 SUF system NifU family Fe-S cluster assembly protein [Acidocella sp. KAb 2-4]
MSDPYQALIVERHKHPLHAGRPAQFDAEGEGANPICGDKVHVYLRRAGMDVHYEAQGCAILSASADLMADAVAGKTAEQIAQLSRDFETLLTTGRENPALGGLNALAGLAAYSSRIRCATLPWSALAEALHHV